MNVFFDMRRNSGSNQPQNLVVEPSSYSRTTASYVFNQPLVNGHGLVEGTPCHCRIELESNEGRTSYRLYDYRYTVPLTANTDFTGLVIDVDFNWRVNPNGETLQISMSPAGNGVTLKSVTLTKR